jgi:hypothetical protein
VLHYDGTAWTVVLAGGVNLRDVWMKEKAVVTVGDDGTILTGDASAFPWNITTRTIATISVLKKMDKKKAAAADNPKPEAVKGPQSR